MLRDKLGDSIICNIQNFDVHNLDDHFYQKFKTS